MNIIAHFDEIDSIIIKLKEQNQVVIKKRSIFVPGLKVNELEFAKQTKDIVGNYFRTKKGYFRRLNNHLQFVPLVTA